MPFIQLQFRRGTATQWTSANPVLADGELAIESDTSKFKIGNGNASWTFLPYGGLVGPTGAIGNTVSIDISFNGNIFVGRDVSFGGNLTVRNDVSFNKELRVGGNVNIRSGAASISSGTGALIVAGGVGVGGNLNVALDASFNNRLFVNNDVSFGAKLCVQSDVSFNGNTSVALLPFYTGNATITPATNQLVTKKYVDENGGTILLGANNVWTANNNFNGNTTVAILPFYTGNATITPAINQLVTKKYVDENGGTILLSANNTWTANNTFNGSRFYVNADASFQNKLTVGDDVSLNTRLFVGRDSSLNGNVFVGRNFVVGGDASFNDNMSVQSDSSFNNRLYVGKQIGVGVTANSVYALDVLGNINLSGNLYLNNKLFSITSADISLNANLMVGADASFNGNVFISKTLNLKKTVITGAATGSPTSIAAATPIVELTGSGASTAYFTLLGGSYAGQTLTIISATNGGGGGLYVNPTGTNIMFNGYNCSQMRFSSAFQTVNFVWSADVSKWIVASWQGVNFGGVSMNFGTYTSGDITLGAAGRVNVNPGVGGMVVGSDSSLNGNLSVGGTDSSFNGNLYIGRRLIGGGDVSFNQRLTVGGADSSFNGNLFVGGFINAEGFVERFVNVASSSGTYTADFNNGLIIYVNAFSGSSTPTLSITNLPTVLNQSYVFTIVYSGPATSTYFSALNINGTSVPVSGSVSLTAASSYYIHQFCIFFTDATNLENNFVVQNFNSSAPLSLVSPSVSGNLSVNGNINLTGGNIFQNGTLFSGGGGAVGTSGNSLSLSGNLYVGGDVSFNGKLTCNGDVSFNGNLKILGYMLANSITAYSSITSTAGNMNAFNITSNNILSVVSTTPSVSNTTGALIVSGGAGVAGNVYAGGVINTTLATASTSTSTGALTLTGTNAGIGVAGNVYTGGIVNVGSTTASSGTGSGALRVAGGAGVAGAVYAGSFNTAGVINTTLATASTSVSTGALTLTGTNAGIGVAGNVYTGGIVNVGSIAVSSGTGTGALTVAGGAGVAGAVYAGSFNTAGVIRTTNATVSANSTTGALIVAGGVGINNNLNVGGNAMVNGMTIGNGGHSESMALGVNALFNGIASGGWTNTAIGYDSLRSQPYRDNTAVGAFTLAAHTGSNSTAVGTSALRFNTTANENTAVGFYALNANITGNNNTAVGASALRFNTTANENTAFGMQALHSNATGNYNTAVGVSALYYGNDKNYSTAIGHSAGSGPGSQPNFVGSYNTFIGSATFQSGTGHYNTYLGYQAHSNGTHGNSTAIGVNSEVTTSNQIVLGRSTEFVSIPGTAASTSVGTGALIVSGGVGVGGNINAGGGFISGNDLLLQGINGSASYIRSTIGSLYLGYGLTNNILVNSTGLTVTGIVAATSFNATSDYRIKQNVHSLCDDASFNVDVLKPVSFVNTQLGKPDIGFIAHEVQEHYPYLVNGVKDGEAMQSLNYTGLIGILVKEIQELKKRVRDLELRTP